VLSESGRTASVFPARLTFNSAFGGLPYIHQREAAGVAAYLRVGRVDGGRFSVSHERVIRGIARGRSSRRVSESRDRSDQLRDDGDLFVLGAGFHKTTGGLPAGRVFDLFGAQ
jgi:hypothetical protein